MATERVSGSRGGPASDIYSLACLLYECLTGRAPFEAGDLREIMGAHLFSAPPRPSIMRRGISRAFDDIIARGMAKKPGDRYATASDLARAAAEAASAAAPASVPPQSTRQFPAVPYAPMPPAPVRRPRRFGPTQVGLIVATLVAFTAAVVLGAVLVFGDHQQRHHLMTPFGSGSTPRTPMAAPPPSTTTPATTTNATPIPGTTGTDAQGFVGHSARCDAGSAPAALIRTANSLAAVCETSPGNFVYHGERLRDGATLQLANAVPTDGGFDVVNPADGARYEVRPNKLTIISNGSVDSAEPALEYATSNG
jgi:serine/threonine-protein kinase